jgi:RND family efflux transporter MFP subunit
MSRTAYGLVFGFPRASLALCAFLPVTVAVVGCHASASSQPVKAGAAKPVETPRVEVVPAEPHPWPLAVRVQGNLVGDEHAVIGAKAAGRIKLVSIDMGSQVKQGDVLATLETEEFDLKVQEAEAQLDQARVALGLKRGESEDRVDRSRVPAVMQEEALRNQARANLQRAKSLAPASIVTAEELEQRQAELEVAEAKVRSALTDVEEQLALVGVRKAALALARQQRIDAEVRAPFTGVVQQRHVAPGTYVQIGQPIVSLVRTDPLRFRAGVPERQAAQLRERQPATIRVEGLTTALTGQVSRISPALDTSNRSLTTEIDLPNSDARLRIGLFAEAEIVVEPDAQALAVPIGAVREFAGVEKVWVVKDGQASERVVMTGRRDADHVEVLRGLVAGEEVVRSAEHGQAGPVMVQSPGPIARDEARPEPSKS